MFFASVGGVQGTANQLLCDSLYITEAEQRQHQTLCLAIWKNFKEALSASGQSFERPEDLLLVAVFNLPRWIDSLVKAPITATMVREIIYRIAMLENGHYPKIGPAKNGLTVGGRLITIEQLSALQLLEGAKQIAHEVVACQTLKHPLEEFIERASLLEWKGCYRGLFGEEVQVDSDMSTSQAKHMLALARQIQEQFDKHAKLPNLPRAVQAGLLLVALSNLPKWLDVLIKAPITRHDIRFVIYHMTFLVNGRYPIIRPHDKGLLIEEVIFDRNQLDAWDLLEGSRQISWDALVAFYVPRPLPEFIDRNKASAWGQTVNVLNERTSLFGGRLL